MTNPFEDLLAAVKRPSSQETAAGAAGADPASAAFSHFTESGVVPASDAIATAAAIPAAGAALAIELSPAVSLILALVTSAKGISASEAIARAICVFAEHIGVPSLLTEIEAAAGRRHANCESGDLHAVPRFHRAAQNRFKR